VPSIGQTWVLASIGAVVEMGVLSTLKRLPMESLWQAAQPADQGVKLVYCKYRIDEFKVSTTHYAVHIIYTHYTFILDCGYMLVPMAVVSVHLAIPDT
jgi:hypothetical protein